MAKLVRWEPLREMVGMRRDLDRLFDETFFRPMMQDNGWHAPLVDLYETEDDVVVKASMPGIHPDDIDIQVSGDSLVIRGETREEAEQKDTTYHMREQRYTSFARSLALPSPVVADKAQAEVVNGILQLTLPKAEEAKPKSIKVKAK